MNHLTEEELVLRYYGEEVQTPSAERHLAECLECRETYSSLQRVLNVVDSLPVPERNSEYGAEVWRKIRPAIPSRRKWLTLPSFEWRWAAAAAATAALMAAAFVAGRHFPQNAAPGQAGRPQITAAADPQAGEKVLLVAVGDYLERSQMVLIELANADPKGKLDISAERHRAADLVSESRLYRQTAQHTGDSTVTTTLDELDRVLLEIAHGPDEVSAAELEHLQKRLESEGILFKMRVLGSKVRTPEEKQAPAPTRGRTAL